MSDHHTIEQWTWTRQAAGKRAHLAYAGRSRCGEATQGTPDPERHRRCGACGRLAAEDMKATIGQVEDLTVWRARMDPQPADTDAICLANGYRPRPHMKWYPNLYLGRGESKHAILYPDGSGSIWKGTPDPRKADEQIASFHCPLGSRGAEVTLDGQVYVIHRILAEHVGDGWDWRVLLKVKSHV